MVDLHLTTASILYHKKVSHFMIAIMNSFITIMVIIAASIILIMELMIINIVA